MPYIMNIFYVGGHIEVEKVHSGRWGRRVPVSEKKKPTSEAVQRVNHRNRIKELRRLILNNFTEDAYHVVLTYQKDNRPDAKTAMKLLDSFYGKMKRRYKKLGIEWKRITVTEYRTAAIHHHLIIPDASGIIKLLKECWPHGHVNLTPLYDNMDIEGLAEYLMKETRETKQKAKYMKKHTSGEAIPNQPPSYTKSGNVKHPRKVTKVIGAKDWRKDPKPLKGYYIDKDSLAEGVSELTGYKYQYYRMVPIRRRE